MVAWAIRQRSDSVLDPSCGDGIFLESAARHLLTLGASPTQIARQIAGLDLNPEAAPMTATALLAALGPRKVALRTTNFFEVNPRNNGSRAGIGPFDAVIGNPPYIRYQEFKGATRSLALQQAARAGVRLPQLASSWAPFVAHAVSFLKRGGRLALILPAELIHAGYAAPIRRYLRDSFDEVSVICFREVVFPGVQEEVVVLLADRRTTSPGGVLRLIEARGQEEMRSIDRLLERSEVFRASSEPTKWLPGHTESPAAHYLTRLHTDGLLVPLGSVGKASIGFVSGANDFFVMTRQAANDSGLPDSSLRPCVVKAQQVPGVLIKAADVRTLAAAGERCLLWLPDEPLTAAERAYVQQGEAQGLHRRFKCRVRTPWYRVPGVIRPEAFLTYMSDSLPRLCLNEAGLAASNNLLTVRLHSIPRALRLAFVVAFYNSATLLSCERIGRSYGGGVLKLEPREAERVMVPDLSIVSKHHDALSALSDNLHRALLLRRPDLLADVVDAIDDVILRVASRRLPWTLDDLRRARFELSGRRRARGRRSLDTRMAPLASA
jgi:methylase of polypeptide subunit release factors